MQLLKNLNTEKGKTILLITHDANVSSYANQTIRIKDGVFIQDQIFSYFYLGIDKKYEVFFLLCRCSKDHYGQ